MGGAAPTGPEGPWEPLYDDPVFLEKLERFLAAFAARYDGQGDLRAYKTLGPRLRGDDG